MSQQKKSLIVFGLAILAAGGIVFGIMQIQKSQQAKQNSVLAAQQEVSGLIEQVGKLIELPQGETPTIATVSDITKLKDQPFFVHAQNGDKVLIYNQSKEAILYRPTENKIVTVAPVNIQATPTIAPTAEVTPDLTVTPTLKQAKIMIKPTLNISSSLTPTITP